jgi:putative membrane protein
MRAWTKILICCLCIGICGVSTYASQESAAADEVWSWSWPPFVVIPLVIAGALYAVGLTRMWVRQHRIGVSLSRTISFVAGWASLLIALDSPLHEWSEQLFWVHMTQHEIFVLVSAPLIVIGRPGLVWIWAFPQSWRNALGSALKLRPVELSWAFVSAPLAAWCLHALALWIWHAPVLFDATLHSDLVHAAQHISFFATAALFWWALLERHSGRLGYGGAVVYVFTTAVHTSLLGALLTFSARAWYPSYMTSAPRWHLSALEDQQIGGLIMWIPAGTVLLLFTLLFLAQWMRHSEERWKLTRTAELIRDSNQTSMAAKLLLVCCLPLFSLAIAGCSRLSAREVKEASLLTNGGDARSGRAAIRKYGCYTCHTIDGVPGAHGLVGPPLNGIGQRYVIAGELPNTPENMMHWIQHPHTVNPRTVMPEMNVSEEDSRNIAAYLYTLR